MLISQVHLFGYRLSGLFLWAQYFPMHFLLLFGLVSGIKFN